MVIAYMEKSSERSIEQKVNKSEYNEAELLSVKTKLNLPYYTSSPEFERAYGSVSINGVVYEYVQKRIYNDTLELLCLPNGAKTALQHIKNDLTQSSAADQSTLPAKKGTTLLKISLPDFCQMTETTAAVAEYESHDYLLQNESFSLTGYAQQQERPPQTI